MLYMHIEVQTFDKCWTAENMFRVKIGYNFVEKKTPYFRPKSLYQKCPISLFGPKNVSHVCGEHMAIEHLGPVVQNVSLTSSSKPQLVK